MNLAVNTVFMKIKSRMFHASSVNVIDRVYMVPIIIVYYNYSMLGFMNIWSCLANK